MPGSLLGLRRFSPCGPYVPFLCHVANADLGTKDEAFEQREERGRFGWGWVMVDEVGGRRGRGRGEEEDVVEDAALLERFS